MRLALLQSIQYYSLFSSEGAWSSERQRKNGFWQWFDALFLAFFFSSYFLNLLPASYVSRAHEGPQRPGFG